MKFRLLLFAACLFGFRGIGQSDPATMTRLVVRLESPDASADSFSAKPKTIYRAGTRYCRVEELPDPEQKLHAVIIVNEPDVWMVNLLDNSGRHIVDDGPSFNCRLPMFSDDAHTPGAKSISELEFGRELEYFHNRKAAAGKGPVLNGGPTKAYVVQIGGTRLSLFTSGTPEHPVAVAREQGSAKETYWYAAYQKLPFNKTLFGKPAGVKMQEPSPR